MEIKTLSVVGLSRTNFTRALPVTLYARLLMAILLRRYAWDLLVYFRSDGAVTEAKLGIQPEVRSATINR